MRLLWSLAPCTLLNAVYDAHTNSSCIWICCDCGLPNFSRSFFDSCIEVQTRNFSRLLTTVVLIIPPLLTAQMPKLRLASDFPCRRPALLLRFQIREQGTSRGRQVGFKTPLRKNFANQAPPTIVITTSQALAHPSLILAIRTNWEYA